jgi:hypothetical protein
MCRSHRFAACLAAAVVLLQLACSARKPQTYRLIPQDRAHILVPPGVAGPIETQGSLVAAVAEWGPACAPPGNALSIQARKRNIRVTVSREALLAQPPGWLSQWTADAEEQGCFVRGAGLEFAMRVLESVPIDPSAAFRLLHADNIQKGYIDLGLEDRLQVVSPILKAGTDPDAPIIETATASGNDRQLNLALRSSDNLIGVETAWYAFQPRPDGTGSTIVPLSAERSIQGKVEPAAAPITNYFQFSPRAAFYRMFYKTDPADSGITEIVVTAPSRAELDRRTQAMVKDLSMCPKSDPEMCMVIPRRVAVNPFMLATVNGAEVRLAIGSTVRRAILAGQGPARPQEVLPQLKVLKLYKGKLVPVEFDHTKQDVLDLVLLGGESVAWK